MTVKLDFSEKMRSVDRSVQPNTPEQEEKVIRLLQTLNAEDLIPTLGLSVPQVTNASSDSDSKLLA